MEQTIPKIKQGIFYKLYRSEKWLKYSELYDRDIENDLFNYHLQHLVKKGYVLKEANLYHISDAGIKYTLGQGSVDGSSAWVSGVKVNTLNLLLKKRAGKIYVLCNKRKRYPFFNNDGISGGSVLAGEPVLTAAKRNLLKRTGLTGKFSKVLGTIRGTFYYNDSIYQDMFFFVCYCGQFSGKLINRTDLVENHWLTLDEAIRVETDAHFGWKSFLDLYEKLKIIPPLEIPYFTAEETVHLTSLF